MSPPVQAGVASATPDTPLALPPAVVGLPTAPVRGEGLFVRVDRVLARCDGLINRVLPPEANPLARAGAAANVALILAVVTGVLLLVWYSPSLQFAYPSLQAINGRTLGGWVRALHRYSSDLAMLLLLVHAGRTFFARKFADARWLAWVSGVVMIALVWFIGWTGCWLVWDQPAQQVAVSSMRLIDALPVFGEPMSRLYVADRLVPSLLFFVVFFLHMLLPLGIAVGLALHLARVSRAKLLPARRLTVAIVIGVATAAWLLPAPLDAPAQMAVKPEHFTVDAWYLTPLALALRFQHAGLWVALFGTTLLSAAVPWLLGRRRPRTSFSAVVEPARCHACTQCVQDCPFDAITMIPRTDGKPFAAQARVDPLRCVGCGVCAGSCDSEGIGVPWFDTRREEARLEEEIIRAIGRGPPLWVALVCGDIDGGVARFPQMQWNDRLPGYLVHPVPTSSWVQPKFVERLLRHGVHGVLVVRDVRHEAWSRDGSRWVADRLLGERGPKYRPRMAGDNGGAWHVVDFDVSAPAALTRAAGTFRRGRNSGVVSARPNRWIQVAAGAVLALLLAAATLTTSHLHVTNPAPANPELIVSFKALGQMMQPAPYDPAKDANKPIHMRGRSTEKPHRAPVHVRVTVDGVEEQRTFSGMGIGSDGPAIGEWRLPLTPGDHAVTVAIDTGDKSGPLRWQGTIHAEPRRLSVITYEPGAGFRLE